MNYKLVIEGNNEVFRDASHFAIMKRGKISFDSEYTMTLSCSSLKQQRVYMSSLTQEEANFPSMSLYKAIQAIASCFDNVFMNAERVSVFWENFSVLEPDLNCMEEHLQRN